MENKKLICTVGLPRSGKSTWARSRPCPIVNPDSIRLAIHGHRFIKEAEGFVWATAKVMVRALFLAGHDTVILDATNITQRSRDEWLSTEWETYFKVIPTEYKECVDRAAAEEDYEIIPVIERMMLDFQDLAFDELEWKEE